MVRAQHHDDRVPADDAPDAQLHRLVTRERGLLLRRDRVDVARLDQTRQPDAQLACPLEHLAEQEVGAIGAGRADDAVEGVDPLRGLLRVGVGELALEAAQQVEAVSLFLVVDHRHGRSLREAGRASPQSITPPMPAARVAVTAFLDASVARRRPRRTPVLDSAAPELHARTVPLACQGASRMTVASIPSTTLHPARPGARPLSAEDLWKLPRVGAPVPSPEGRSVAVTVTAYDLETT